MAHPGSQISILRRAAQRTRSKHASMYDKYPLPFFDGERRSAWSVRPTDKYSTDCETGHLYALEFLRSCDRTAGWTYLLGRMMTDMVGAGTRLEVPGR